MSDKTKQELHAAIIAEMRDAKTAVPFVYQRGEPDTPEVVDFSSECVIEPCKIRIRYVTIEELADRLEAAHKRELAETGNIAVLREALNVACYAMFDYLTQRCGGYREMAEALDKAKVALAMSARNCDRFKTAAEAEKAFDNFCAKSRTGKCSPATCAIPRNTGAGSCLLAWLFAKEVV